MATFRKKHSAIMHEYYSMAEKYKDYDKKMLTFTVPSTIRGKTIKEGRFTKLRYLLELRAFIAKEFNNSNLDIKYFMNIELGKAYSNPHLHIQLWTKPFCCTQQNDNNIDKHYDDSMSPTSISETSACSKVVQYGKSKFSKAKNIIPINNYHKQSDLIFTDDNKNNTSSHTIDLIKKKAISKFNLQEDRCITTHPTSNNKIYHYVIKDYSKHLSDKEVWNLETQKKRMRDQIGSKVRFYSKSKDKHTQKLYRFAYKKFGVLREFANEFIDHCLLKLINLFSFNKIPQQSYWWFIVSKLCLSRIKQYAIFFDAIFLFIFCIIPSCRDPPTLFLGLIFFKINFKGVYYVFILFNAVFPLGIGVYFRG